MISKINSANLDFSIVIPAYNSYFNKKKSVELVAKCLAKQQAINYDVFFVAAESEDGTLRFLKDFTSDRKNYHLIETPNVLSRSAARNHGASFAGGEWLLFMDDDCMLLNELLLSRLSRFLDGRDWAVGARRKWFQLGWKFDEFNSFLDAGHLDAIDEQSVVPSGIKRGTGRRDLHEFSFIGHFGFVRNELFKKVGGYDEQYRGWGYEDTDLMMRLYIESSAYLNLFELADVYHLTHPISKVDKANRSKNIELYQSKEDNLSISFYVNRIFDVYDDGIKGQIVEKKGF